MKWLTLLLLFFNQATASHIAGGDLTYKWLYGNTYEVTETFYRDCVGVEAPTSPAIYYKSSCYPLGGIYLTLVSSVEVTPACNEGKTTCDSGTAYGVTKNIYTGTITLPPCADWEIYTDSYCCRNGSITNLTTPLSTYACFYATLNNLHGNYSSPTFKNDLLTFVCVGTEVCIDNSATGGDSLSYSLVTPLQNISETVNFAPGYSYDNSIPSSTGFNFDSLTGLSCITPSETGIYVFAVIASSWKNDTLRSVIELDMQIAAQICDCYTLPVTLINFSGTNVRGINSLTWTIASQQNNRVFALFKNGDWLADINGAGTTDIQCTYKYQDVDMVKRWDYYTLESEDFNGKKYDLGTIAVYCEGFNISLSPFLDYDLIGRKIH